MSKEEIINFLYYLLDKIDPIYLEEVKKVIYKHINYIEKNYK